MGSKWLIFNEAEPELQPCPRLLRSPPPPLAHKLQGKNNQWCGKPVAACPDEDSRAWKPGWSDSHSWKDLMLGLGGHGLQSWSMLYLIRGLRKPNCQCILMLIIRGIESMGLEQEYLSWSLGCCRQPSLTFLHPHFSVWVKWLLFGVSSQCLVFLLSWYVHLLSPPLDCHLQ